MVFNYIFSIFFLAKSKRRAVLSDIVCILTYPSQLPYKLTAQGRFTSFFLQLLRPLLWTNLQTAAIERAAHVSPDLLEKNAPRSLRGLGPSEVTSRWNLRMRRGLGPRALGTPTGSRCLIKSWFLPRSAWYDPESILLCMEIKEYISKETTISYDRNGIESVPMRLHKLHLVVRKEVQERTRTE